MAINYFYAKKNIPDWEAYCFGQLKSELKVLVFDKWLATHNEQKVIEATQKEIRLFTAVIPNRELAKSYHEELTEYVNELMKECADKLGRATARTIAMALSQSLTDVQKRFLNQVATNAAIIDIKEPKQMGMLADVAQKASKNADYGYNRASEGGTYYKDLQSQIKGFLRDYKSHDRPKGYIYSGNERNLAEMNARYEAYKANKQALIDKGVKVVYVPAHANCSKRCQPFQGRLYSLDGTKGSIDGRNYIPIEDVSDKVTYTSTRTGRTYFAGLFSYNCRHTLEEYHQGQNIEEIPDDVIERQRSLEEQQRLIERTYRKGREEYMLMSVLYRQSKDASLHKQLVELGRRNAMIRRAYYAYCDKNNLPQYRDRLKLIYAEDIENVVPEPQPIPIQEPIVEPVIENGEIDEVTGEYIGEFTPSYAVKALKETAKFRSVDEEVFKKVDPVFMRKATYQLERLETKYGAIGGCESVDLVEYQSTSAYACIRRKRGNFDKMSYEITTSKFIDLETYVAGQRNAQRTHFKMPATDENLPVYTITHEYGHVIEQRLFMRKMKSQGWKQTRDDDVWDLDLQWKFETFCSNVRKDLLALAKQMQKGTTLRDMSGYGNSDPAEFFAEAFANSQLGNPNGFGKAMIEYLKREGLGDGN